MDQKKIIYVAAISMALFFLCGSTALCSDEMTATRSISDSSVNAGDTFTVTIDLHFNNQTDSPAIEERLPFGWTISEVDFGDAAFKSGNTRTTWMWDGKIDSGETLSISYNVNVSDSTSSGEYLISGNVSGYDSALVGGDQIEIEIAGDQKVTVVGQSSSSSSTSTSSSGGGGGGGGGTSGEAYENILKKDVETVFINKGSSVKYEFTSDENSIDYVQFTGLKNSGKISTTIEVLNDRSTYVDSDAPGLVYQNMNIWVGKVGFATSDNIEDPVIGFSVEKSWMDDNGLTSDGISLYRYSDDVWNKLETTVLSEDDTRVYFESTTPGFSPFAISAPRADVAESPAASEDDTEDLKSTPENDEGEQTTQQEGTPSTPGVGFAGTMFVMVVAGVFTAMKGRK
ncbi:PGF-pre-PGF domain-containing protein [uncultured Methanolobus sp.]|uniref:PGF-pre-PGF domain-containing protein n=1 Tax=uncultured Methanolobus sp. TaxID=218300 RepID=UPI002AAA6489|nr:PGF-pre-PGF domain-containing protein [uncultured Methanolobus sp.]